MRSSSWARAAGGTKEPAIVAGALGLRSQQAARPRCTAAARGTGEARGCSVGRGGHAAGRYVLPHGASWPFASRHLPGEAGAPYH
eukprot:663245-Pleurochrysis_carterae.AAC.2